jgi:hypothetical protein
MGEIVFINDVVSPAPKHDELVGKPHRGAWNSVIEAAIAELDELEPCLRVRIKRSPG